MIVQEPVQAAIWHCLNHYAYADAAFLAERLYAEVESDESLFLLATSYYRSGKTHQAYSILKDKASTLRHSQSRYLLACCAHDLNKYAEAETVLCGDHSVCQSNLDDFVLEFGEQASFALQLLARICAKTERGSKASEAFRKALKLNPFLWTCFVDLCDRGEKPDPRRTFKVSHLDNLSMCHGVTPSQTYVENITIMPTYTVVHGNEYDNVETTPKMTNALNYNCNAPINHGKVFAPIEESPTFPIQSTRYKFPRYRLFGGTANNSPLTPSFGILPLETPSPDGSIEATPFGSTNNCSQNALTEANDQKSLAKRVRAHVGQFISRKEGPLQQSKPVFSQSTNIAVGTPNTPPIQNVRRSSRLFSNSYSVKENNKSPNRGKFVTPKSPSRKTKQRISKSNLNKTSYNEINARNLKSEKEKSETVTSVENKSSSVNGVNSVLNQSLMQQALVIQKQSAEGLMSLLQDLGYAYQCLAHFNCRKAIECLNNLPARQYNTYWVLSTLAMAYFELSEYRQAVNYFKEVHEKESCRMDYMEMYSTALWHLQEEVTLSTLAQDLVELDKNSPVTWCVAGNCFSLHKEHDTAIKLFQRAVQVDPKFTYAYTLLGHEYVMTEELDKAMSCFRNAVRLDPRHYNAWFGIGTIYSKQERFELAEIHYRRALAINSQSSVLMCHIGVVQHALKKTDKALQTLNIAINNAPKNPLCKFHRGSIYFAAGRHAEALKELEELKKIVPKESLVYYLIGKVHKKLGNTHLALMHFSWATDLDPKGANSLIKEAFEPALSRCQTDEESRQTPTTEYRAEEQQPEQDSVFHALPEDSDDSL